MQNHSPAAEQIAGQKLSPVLMADHLRKTANEVNSVDIPQALLHYLNKRAEEGYYDAKVEATQAFGFSKFLLDRSRWGKIVDKLKGQGLSVREQFEDGELRYLEIRW
ncbi:hypothetical protein CHUUTOTORO_01480 [Serratia phage vB_SmaM-ChuuTotoro]|nr:hypothetical protein CHUUTOTORO_01480 [Serratia phage vB_SmaM-ChuuTotoro]